MGFDREDFPMWILIHKFNLCDLGKIAVEFIETSGRFGNGSI